MHDHDYLVRLTMTIWHKCMSPACVWHVVQPIMIYFISDCYQYYSIYNVGINSKPGHWTVVFKVLLLSCTFHPVHTSQIVVNQCQTNYMLKVFSCISLIMWTKLILPSSVLRNALLIVSWTKYNQLQMNDGKNEVKLITSSLSYCPSQSTIHNKLDQSLRNSGHS